MDSFDLYYPLILLAIGVFTIFFLIIYLKVHAFLALIAAALLVGLLSPRVLYQTPELDSYQKLTNEMTKQLAGRNEEEIRKDYELRVQQTEKVRQSPDSRQQRLHLTNAPELVAAAFGRLMAGIGLSIAFATIIGAALMESGAADRIVRSVTRLFGEPLAGFALMVSGYILAIPVFFDTVFLLLIPLAKALYLRTGKNYLLYIVAIGAGGAVTHSLVPPTPGPLTMSEILQVDLGMTIFVGVLVGFPISCTGFLYGALIDRIAPVPLREVGETSLQELERRSQRPDHELPSLWASLLPIVLPVFFITSATVYGALLKSNPEWTYQFDLDGVNISLKTILDFLGDKNISLLTAAVISMILVVRRCHLSRSQLARFTARALDDAGMILLITCAGGAFGSLLNAVGVGESIHTLSEAWKISPLVLAWGLAAMFKVAQGSGTVSMITTATIMFGIISSQLGSNATAADYATYLGYHPVYLIMAIGCGSKVGSWMNDSGFWVVCKMSGMTEVETLKSWTLCLVIMGIVGLPLVWLLTIYLPLI